MRTFADILSIGGYLGMFLSGIVLIGTFLLGLIGLVPNPICNVIFEYSLLFLAGSFILAGLGGFLFSEWNKGPFYDSDCDDE